MEIIEREYEYKPGWLVILLGGGMFGFAAVFFANLARSNDRGLIINHIVELSETGATYFYWTMCFLSACFVAATAAMIFHRFKFRQRVAFVADSIIVPAKRFSGEEKIVRFKDIAAISESSINGQDFLTIRHSGGKTVIARNMLPSKEIYREIVERLAEKVIAANR